MRESKTVQLVFVTLNYLCLIISGVGALNYTWPHLTLPLSVAEVFDDLGITVQSLCVYYDDGQNWWPGGRGRKYTFLKLV